MTIKQNAQAIDLVRVIEDTNRRRKEGRGKKKKKTNDGNNGCALTITPCTGREQQKERQDKQNRLITVTRSNIQTKTN